MATKRSPVFQMERTVSEFNETHEPLVDTVCNHVTFELNILFDLAKRKWGNFMPKKQFRILLLLYASTIHMHRQTQTHYRTYIVYTAKAVDTIIDNHILNCYMKRISKLEWNKTKEKDLFFSSNNFPRFLASKQRVSLSTASHQQPRKNGNFV